MKKDPISRERKRPIGQNKQRGSLETKAFAIDLDWGLLPQGQPQFGVFKFLFTPERR